MDWFSKLVTTAYTWTDLIVKNRQKKVDNAYNVKKAEEKAAEIMKQQQERNQKRTSALGKRSADNLEGEGVDEFEEWFDVKEYAEFLHTFLEE